MTDFDREFAALLDADPGTEPSPVLDPDEVGIDGTDLNETSSGTADRDRTRLHWRWADEMATSTPAEPDWIFEGYLAPGTKTIIAGLPKAGKTTLVAAVIEAVAHDAGTFLGRSVRGGTVLLASEEGDLTLAPKLRGLPAGRVRVLNRDACWPQPSWPDLIAGATAEAQNIGACLLVLDSLAFWAALEGDRENEAGTAQAIFSALDEACRAGLAVLIVHHQRKAVGANHGTGVRGSGAIAGAVDVILEYERLGEEATPSHRRIVSLSRWPATPDVLVLDYERTDGTWRVVGEAASRDAATTLGVRGHLRDQMPAEPPGATEGELAELIHLDKRKVAGPLREMHVNEEVERTGNGVKGDPFRYHLKAPPGFSPPQGEKGDSDSPPPLKGGRIESSPSESAPQTTGEKGTPQGCPSHPEPLASCRYCRPGEQGT
ncbi:MAG: AAA family ATPase [Solirubrobacterales bacterium]